MFAKSISKCVIALASVGVFLSLASSAFATTYYLSPTGDDAETGEDSSAPRQTMSFSSSLQPGDEVIFLDGTYTQSVPFRIQTSGTEADPIVIRAENPGQAILDAGGDNTTKAVWLSGDYLTFSDFVVQNIESECIWIDGDHVTVDNNTVTDCSVSGIFASEADNTIITNNTVYNTNTQNSCRGCTGWGSGIKLQLTTNSTISDNTVYENYGEGIAATRADTVEISNNTTYNNFSQNIYVDNSYDVLVRENFSYCTPNSGFEWEGRRTTGIGLGEESYSGWGAQLANVEILHNLVVGCRLGVSLYTELDGTVNGLIVDHNTFWNSTLRPLDFQDFGPASSNITVSNNINHVDLSATVTGTQNLISLPADISMFLFERNFWSGDDLNDNQASHSNDGLGDPELINPGSTTPTDYAHQDPSASDGYGAYYVTGESENTQPSPTPTATPCPAYPADYDDSCYVDILDYSAFISDFKDELFQSGEDLVSDLDENGVVDLRDYSVFVASFKDYYSS